MLRLVEAGDYLPFSFSPSFQTAGEVVGEQGRVVPRADRVPRDVAASARCGAPAVATVLGAASADSAALAPHPGDLRHERPLPRREAYLTLHSVAGAIGIRGGIDRSQGVVPGPEHANSPHRGITYTTARI